MARQADPLKRRSLDRRILALAVPALGALAADPLLSLVDTAFVSRLGTEALGALGIDTAIFSFAFLAFNFLAYATTPMVARRAGAGDTAGAGRVVVQALALAGALGIVSSLVIFASAEWLVRAMQAGPDLVDPAVTYLRIRCLGAPAVLVVMVGHGAFRGMQDTRTPLWIALAISAINLILDPVLIFGVGLGVAGAALATLVAQVAGAVWFGVLFLRLGKVQGWSWSRPSLRELTPMLGTGGVLTLRTLFLTGMLTAATAVAASFGAASVAAHQVVSQIWLLLALTVDALAISAQAMVADEIGRGDKAAATAVAARLGRWGVGVGIFLTLALLAGRGLLADFFAPEPAVGDLMVSALVVAALMQIVAAAVFVADGVFLGLLQVKYLAYSTLAGAIAGGLFLWVAVAAGWGLDGVWWAIAVMVTLRLVTLAVAYPRALRQA